MPTVFLTSRLDVCDRDTSGCRIPKHFGNQNNIRSNLQRKIRKQERFLFVAADEQAVEENDRYAQAVFASFDRTLPFAQYDLLDCRTENRMGELVQEADFIFLCGGHLPTQNRFFQRIGFAQQMKHTQAVVCGGSAGSMNCAARVYCPPELEGESLDPSFQRFRTGLGLTQLNIFPHFAFFRDHVLDGKAYVEEILLPDSFHTPIYAICDGAYFLLEGDSVKLYGEGYLLDKGRIKQLSEDGQVFEISKV